MEIVDSPIETIPAKEVAKILRKKLKERWPDIKFSVRKYHHPYGSHISVKYSGNLPRQDVKNFVRNYEALSYDPVDDKSFVLLHWLCPNGDAIPLAKFNPSLGPNHATTLKPPVEGAKLVHLGSDLIFVNSIEGLI